MHFYEVDIRVVSGVNFMRLLVFSGQLRRVSNLSAFRHDRQTADDRSGTN